MNFYSDDCQLIYKCKEGDKEALNTFYTRFAPKMLGVIRRYISNPNDAEDILHDGFIVAFTLILTFCGRCGLNDVNAPFIKDPHR